MRSLKPEYREAERNAGCRACSKTINKGEKMVSWYSHWNSGMHIILCKDCVSGIYDLVCNQLQTVGRDKNEPDIQTDI